MSDEQYLKETYTEFLDDDASPECVRLIRDIKTLSSADQLPQYLGESIRRNLLDSFNAPERHQQPHRSRSRRVASKRQGSGGRSRNNRWFFPSLKALDRVLRVGGMAAFIVVVGVTAIGLSMMLSQRILDTKSNPTDNQIMSELTPEPVTSFGVSSEASVSPLLSGQGVLHIRATEQRLTATGIEMETYPIEFWHDPAVSNARLDKRNAAGTEQQRLVRERATYADIDPLQNKAYMMTESTSYPIAFLKPVDQMFRYKIALDEGEMAAIGEEMVVGKLAIVATDKEVASEASPEVKVYIDKANGLTLKETGIDYETASGSAVQDGIIVTQYHVIERVSSSQLPGDLFSLPGAPPPDGPPDDGGSTEPQPPVPTPTPTPIGGSGIVEPSTSQGVSTFPVEDSISPPTGTLTPSP